MEKPPLLLLDEPLNGLDSTGILDIRKLINEGASELGMTILFSTYVLSEMPYICTRVCALVGGKLTELSPEEFSDYRALEQTYRKLTGYSNLKLGTSQFTFAMA